jgi:outer membrane biosynthesis protein TonB
MLPMLTATWMPAQSPVRVRVGSTYAAKLINRVEPEYPKALAAVHVKGDVELTYGIDANGHVINIKVISGDRRLAPWAVRALSQWLYRPTLLNGDPVEIHGATTTITFPPRIAPVQVKNANDGTWSSHPIRKVDPEYPSITAPTHVYEAVGLMFVIDTAGHVKNIRVVSGPPALQDAAVKAVSQWTYRPIVLNGEPVEVMGRADILGSA